MPLCISRTNSGAGSDCSTDARSDARARVERTLLSAAVNPVEFIAAHPFRRERGKDGAPSVSIDDQKESWRG